ncbi:hypothetical protein EMIHUDRAFT_103951 [Emiliania huxleyi CCMP1516]|uniref:Methyltransferase FkbM domain-containing protein n=3 Tax=Emiliania huxleyi TaxID=2903 RepID=A0A0D3IPH5_EMIH1|nr:hypothetical protein EMIHUDRAFT_103951 [Emiliania huxleyi CCMP1516]EOD13160.1 hypothetical protein EMIHUDRAFT_103951 [Emiliania huxleyi CCMP1516]|eukprot:XP_005765589.1 hypothetical protein EMIHUDRAFT_103951 [Emiliania huxleyi CCMP1516]
MAVASTPLVAAPSCPAWAKHRRGRQPQFDGKPCEPAKEEDMWLCLADGRARSTADLKRLATAARVRAKRARDAAAANTRDRQARDQRRRQREQHDRRAAPAVAKTKESAHLRKLKHNPVLAIWEAGYADGEGVWDAARAAYFAGELAKRSAKDGRKRRRGAGAASARKKQAAPTARSPADASDGEGDEQMRDASDAQDDGQLLHTAAVLRRKLGVHIEVFNGTAFAELDGTAMFGLDSTTGNAEGSSLMLHKRTKTREGLGRGPAVGEHRVRVRTVNALSVIRHAPPGPVALKIDVEGYEGRLMRNLLLSGVLCQRVQNLFVEWHLMASQVDKRDLHHPDEDIEMPPQTMAVYKWMLSTFNPKAKALGRNWQPLADSSCNLTLLNWS